MHRCLHTEYEWELVPLFVKVRMYLSGSEKKEYAVDCIKIVTVKLHFQLYEQCGLL